MPRISKRQRYLNELRSLFNFRMYKRACRMLTDEDDSLEDTIDCALALAVQKGNKKRYLFRAVRSIENLLTVLKMT